jgi:uncharacterized protein YegL
MSNYLSVRNNDLIENPSPRCACILVLDTSGSMSGDAIEELNLGLSQFIKEIKEDEFASYSVEVGIITAGGRVAEQLPITPAHQIESFTPLDAGGDTPLGVAVSKALDCLENRKNDYKKAGVAYYQPWLVLISDGEPTDNWQSTAQRAQDMAKQRKLVVISIGVKDANLAKLSAFSSRPAKLLAGLKFREFFEWLSQSMTRVSSSASTSATVNLPSTDGWDSV